MSGPELRVQQVDAADREALRTWWRTVGVAFLNPEGEDARFEEVAGDLATRRLIGVYDDTAAEPAVPVATLDSWTMPLTLPGGAALPAWAISAVSVAPTHRRQGVARRMLEGELRAAAEAGAPLAILTVSEAVLYGRYGFGPATCNADLVVDTRRAGWRGPETPGRVHRVSRATMLQSAAAIDEAAARRTPGAVAAPGLLATRVFGLPSDDADLRARRILRYDDAAGRPQGYAVYRTTPAEDETGFARSSATLLALVGATDDAITALWRTVLSLDLIGTLHAGDRPVDDPVRFLVADPRGVRTVDVRDHLWVRVLDVRAALEARRWNGPGAVEIDVTDPLGYAGGPVRLEVGPDGSARVLPADGARVALGVDVLGSLLLGGASAAALAAAGRITGDADGIEQLDRLARTARAPWLGLWF